MKTFALPLLLLLLFKLSLFPIVVCGDDLPKEVTEEADHRGDDEGEPEDRGLCREAPEVVVVITEAEEASAPEDAVDKDPEDVDGEATPVGDVVEDRPGTGLEGELEGNNDEDARVDEVAVREDAVDKAALPHNAVAVREEREDKAY